VQVLLRLWKDNAQWFHLVNGGVGTVEEAGGNVQANIAAEAFAEFVDEIGGKRHGWILPLRQAVLRYAKAFLIKVSMTVNFLEGA
jgi:hypothetical protein